MTNLKQSNRQIINTETQRYALLGVLFGLLFPVLATLIQMRETNLSFSFENLIKIQASDTLLWVIDTAPLFLGIFAALAGRREDNLQKVIRELKIKENELKKAREHLERRVEERTAALNESSMELQERVSQLEAIANTARSVASAQMLDQLLPAISQDISKRFGFYHVGIFLLDSTREYAILSAANSEGGQKMLTRGHRLKVGEQGIVGYVTFSGNPRIALDVGEDAVFFNNLDLPETHSEVALPLKFGREIIGALDIQSTESNAFSRDDVEIFSILADQVSVAIQNKKSLEQAQRALKEAEIATSHLTAQSWTEYTENANTKGYRYDGIKPEPLKETSEPLNEKEALLVPVQFRGKTIGRLKLRAIEQSRIWTEDELAIIESTADRVAIALDGARLLNDAQKQASRETFLSEVAAKLGTSFQLDSILRDTVEELGQTLKGSTISFQLVNPSALPSEEFDNGNSKDEIKSE
jgi:GAF domain-containing protein